MNDGRGGQLRPIGWVRSSLTEVATAPRQGDEGAPDAIVVLNDEVLPGADDLRAGDEIIVVTWLDRARRDVLVVHPRDDDHRPLRGVFSTRSADRPNPIGLHRVTILSIDGPTICVSNLEAVDGTPVIDIKPVLEPINER